MSKLIFGNWKMNLSAAASAEMASKVACAKDYGDLEVVVFPTFTALSDVLKATGGAPCAKVGGQDCFWETRGAYTGEVSAAQLKEIGCSHVLIGHSERRRHLHETDAMVNHKLKAARAAGLTPVLCIGESDDERRAGLWAAVIEGQVTKGLAGVNVGGNDQIIIAYEPVWAVGTGRACEPEAAREAHALVMNSIAEIYGPEVARQHFRLIYGGSVDATNIASYLAEEGIDGALVGGASQQAATFSALLEAAAAK